MFSAELATYVRRARQAAACSFNNKQFHRQNLRLVEALLYESQWNYMHSNHLKKSCYCKYYCTTMTKRSYNNRSSARSCSQYRFYAEVVQVEAACKILYTTIKKGYYCKYYCLTMTKRPCTTSNARVVVVAVV